MISAFKEGIQAKRDYTYYPEKWDVITSYSIHYTKLYDFFNMKYRVTMRKRSSSKIEITNILKKMNS